ncbi:hypothetical protein KOW79_022762 [Hemibagrus wyckioides]|uniref:SEA domain-containing protein n=1 Tax=Hemibagrus wyckioides TaxID=337641 RepID=A0A9D3N1G6_9TELE|nr:hypothetical protein KOW79_022762 [Hemibagrus wyckioides]
MDWKLVLTVLCMTVTTNSTTNMTPSMSMNTTSTNSTLTNSPSTNSPSTNSTSTNSTSTNSTLTNSTLTNSTLTNSPSTNSSSTNSTLTNSTSTNSTLTNSSSTNSSSTNSPSTNSSSTNSTSTNSTSTNSTLTNSSSTNSSSTNSSSTNSTSTNSNSTNSTLTNSPSTNSTLTNSTLTNSAFTNSTSTNSTLTNTSSTLSMATNTSTTNTSSVAAVFNLVFSINETFDPALANSSSPEFAAKSTSIRNRFEPFYRQNCSNFLQMIIHGYSKGSIVTNSSLEFSANDTIPTNSTLQNILVNATKSNSNLNIILNSISVIQVPGQYSNCHLSSHSTVTNYWTTNTSLTMSTTNIPPTPENASAVFNLTFSISETFDSALASTCSPQFGAKAANIRNQVEPLYKKAFKNFILMQILRFKNGSIIAESKLYMDPSGSNVTATQVKDVFLNGIAIFNFNVDPASIRVTQIGNSMPPVIASSVSMICMSLLSLLLSLTLHF